VVKMIRFGAAALVAVLVFGTAAAVNAQESKPTPPKPAQIQLRLQLVLSRYQGDKKISSVPYQMWVTTNEDPARLRMGVQVPVPTTTVGTTPGTTPTSSYSLKDVGTQIDCRATTGVEAGVYKIGLTVNDSGFYNTSAQHAAPESSAPAPTYRNFTSTFTILLRDGQTAQYTTATDPVSGEVLKIDATLNVLK
jgi:type II secretory pathway component GspD/PulD (secretin)